MLFWALLPVCLLEWFKTAFASHDGLPFISLWARPFCYNGSSTLYLLFFHYLHTACRNNSQLASLRNGCLTSLRGKLVFFFRHKCCLFKSLSHQVDRACLRHFHQWVSLKHSRAPDSVPTCCLGNRQVDWNKWPLCNHPLPPLCLFLPLSLSSTTLSQLKWAFIFSYCSYQRVTVGWSSLIISSAGKQAHCQIISHHS